MNVNYLEYSIRSLFRIVAINNLFKICFIFIVLLLFFKIYSLYFNILFQKYDLIIKEADSFHYRARIENQKNKIALFYSLFNSLKSGEEVSVDNLKKSRMVTRIISLSSSEKISNYWKVENLDCQIIDLKRELLLLNLFYVIADTILYKKFVDNVSFYGTDLNNLDLHGMNLKGINLKNANLENANLEGVNLNNANLSNANLIDINLNNATLIGANLIGAKLNRAKLNECNLHLAKLDSADLSNSSVQKSNLYRSSLINTIICNADFSESNLSDCLLSATYMSNVNFSKANLKNSEIYDTDIGTAILDSAIVNENWSELLIKRNTSSVYLMLKKYKIIKDSLAIKDSIIYLVNPILN